MGTREATGGRTRWLERSVWVSLFSKILFSPWKCQIFSCLLCLPSHPSSYDHGLFLMWKEIHPGRNNASRRLEHQEVSYVEKRNKEAVLVLG